MSDKRMNRRLTIKQRKLMKYHLEGHTIKDAAIMAGYSKYSAYTHGSRVLKRLYECGAVNEWLEILGLSDQCLAMKIIEGLDAKKADGTPDYAVRYRYIEMALKLRGAFVEKTNVEHDLGDTLFDIMAKANEVPSDHEEPKKPKRFLS